MFGLDEGKLEVGGRRWWRVGRVEENIVYKGGEERKGKERQHHRMELTLEKGVVVSGGSEKEIGGQERTV